MRLCGRSCEKSKLLNYIALYIGAGVAVGNQSIKIYRKLASYIKISFVVLYKDML